MSESATSTDPAPNDSARNNESVRSMVDWEFAAAAASRLAPPGPRAARGEVEQLVTDLRSSAERAVDPVAGTARLSTPAGVPPALIVDRPGWIKANAASMGAMLEPVLDELLTRRQAAEQARAQAAGREARPMSAAGAWVGSRITGSEVAGMLSWISTKVLGQYDLAPQGTPRLLFVAPNILAAERELDVDPTDFRLWVAMHEETHRVQFTAVPWLRGHVIERARQIGSEVVPDVEDFGARLQELAGKLPAVLRGQEDITQVLATPEQRLRLAEVTAIMSLLEGHADVIMDEVGPSVIPTVAQIRAKFNQRRKGAGNVDKMLRRLMGMEAKMRQYRDGAVFVRAVMDEVGVEGFNRIWDSPETLPLPTEIADPSAWIARVHG